MKLSTKVRYAVRALAELASHPPSEPVLLKDISRNQGISLKYLDHIFAQLKTKGLISKLKAKKGGYLLAKPAAEITLHEIVEALEGMELVFCVERVGACPRDRGCGARVVWKKLQDSFKETLKNITLQDVADENRKLAPGKESYTFHI